MDIKNKKVLILGISVTGLGAVKFLHTCGANIFVSEFDEKKKDSKEFEEIKKYTENIEIGHHSEEFIEGSSYVILSPSIPHTSKIIQTLKEKNIPYMSDIEFAYKFLQGGENFVAITGTNGKTTTTMLTSHILYGQFRAPYCGNIGISPLEIIKDNDFDYLTLEMSSYQGHYSPTFAPHIAIFCNLTPDHIGFHGNIENYFEAKAKIFRNQGKNDFAILNYDDEMVKKLGGELNSTVYYYSVKEKTTLSIQNNSIYFKDEKIIDIADIPLVGEHNYQNVMCAIAAAKILNIPNEIIKKQIMSFRAPEHRCEFVREADGIKFYNDSKATNPEATLVALKAFVGQNVCLIAGGRDKNTSLDEFVEEIKKNIETVVLIGEATERFKEALLLGGYKNIIFADSLNDAIEKSIAKKPDVVLLSPACASFDMFKSFEDRGEKFKNYVNNRKF